VVLPHQYSLGDSRSLSDSLCRTDKNRFLFHGNLCGRQDHVRFSCAENASEAGIAHRDGNTVVRDEGMLEMQEQLVSGRS
jgi:hypothetical protein